MHHKHKPPTGNFRWAVSFYGRLKAEAGTHSVRVITSANQIVIADMGVEELLHRHIAVNPDLRAAKIILVQIFDNLAGRDKVVTQIRAGLEIVTLPSGISPAMATPIFDSKCVSRWYFSGISNGSVQCAKTISFAALSTRDGLHWNAC